MVLVLVLMLVLVLVGVGIGAGAGESSPAPPAPPSNLLFLPPVFSCFCSWSSPAPPSPAALLSCLLLCSSLLLPLLLLFSPPSPSPSPPALLLSNFRIFGYLVSFFSFPIDFRFLTLFSDSPLLPSCSCSPPFHYSSLHLLLLCSSLLSSSLLLLLSNFRIFDYLVGPFVFFPLYFLLFDPF